MPTAQALEALLPPGAWIDAAARRAAEAALPELGARGMGRPVGAEARRALLFRLARRLCARREFHAAGAIVDTLVPLVTPQECFLKGQILEALGLGEALKAHLAASTAIYAGSELAALHLGMRLRHGLETDHAFLSALFGPVPQDIGAALCGLDVSRWRPPALVAAARRLHGALPDPAPGLADYENRFAWGIAAQVFCQAILGAGLADDLAPLRAGLLKRIRRPGLAAPAAAARAGHSVLFARVHAGVPSVITRGLGPDAVDLPDISIARNVRSGPTPRGGLYLGTADFSPPQFLRILKAVRQRPHQIRIFPDGAAGDDRVPATLLGHDITLGRGAAALAWHGRAATFFVATRWHGTDEIEVRLVPGPVAGATHTDQGAFEAAFHAFYIDALSQILTGPPGDIGLLRGGTWNTVLFAPQNKGGPRPAGV